MPLRIVVIDDQVLLVRQRSHGSQGRDLHRAVQVGSGQGDRSDGVQFAAREGADDYVAALHLGVGMDSCRDGICL